MQEFEAMEDNLDFSKYLRADRVEEVAVQMAREEVEKKANEA